MTTREALDGIWAGARAAEIEGLMLKRRQSSLSRRTAERSLVQMEARASLRRLRVDVRAARIGKAVFAILGLYVRRLG